MALSWAKCRSRGKSDPMVVLNKAFDGWMDESTCKQPSCSSISRYFFKFPLTALDLQRAGLGVQREAAEVHVAHGGDCDSAEANSRDTKKTTRCDSPTASSSKGGG